MGPYFVIDIFKELYWGFIAALQNIKKVTLKHVMGSSDCWKLLKQVNIGYRNELK